MQGQVALNERSSCVFEHHWVDGYYVKSGERRKEAARASPDVISYDTRRMHALSER